MNDALTLRDLAELKAKSESATPDNHPEARDKLLELMNTVGRIDLQSTPAAESAPLNKALWPSETTCPHCGAPNRDWSAESAKVAEGEVVMTTAPELLTAQRAELNDWREWGMKLCEPPITCDADMREKIGHDAESASCYLQRLGRVNEKLFNARDGWDAALKKLRDLTAEREALQEKLESTRDSIHVAAQKLESVRTSNEGAHPRPSLENWSRIFGANTDLWALWHSLNEVQCGAVDGLTGWRCCLRGKHEKHLFSRGSRPSPTREAKDSRPVGGAPATEDGLLSDVAPVVENTGHFDDVVTHERALLLACQLHPTAAQNQEKRRYVLQQQARGAKDHEKPADRSLLQRADAGHGGVRRPEVPDREADGTLPVVQPEADSDAGVRGGPAPGAAGETVLASATGEAKPGHYDSVGTEPMRCNWVSGYGNRCTLPAGHAGAGHAVGGGGAKPAEHTCILTATTVNGQPPPPCKACQANQLERCSWEGCRNLRLKGTWCYDHQPERATPRPAQRAACGRIWHQSPEYRWACVAQQGHVGPCVEPADPASAAEVPVTRAELVAALRKMAEGTPSFASGAGSPTNWRRDARSETPKHPAWANECLARTLTSLRAQLASALQRAEAAELENKAWRALAEWGGVQEMQNPSTHDEHRRRTWSPPYRGQGCWIGFANINIYPRDDEETARLESVENVFHERGLGDSPQAAAIDLATKLGLLGSLAQSSGVNQRQETKK